MKIVLCIIGVFFSILSGYLLEGGHIMALHQPAELLIIGGAAGCSFAVANPMHVIKGVATKIPLLLTSSPYNKDSHMDLLGLMYSMFAKIRKEGIIAIERDVEDPQQSPIFSEFPALTKNAHAKEFICDYFRLMVSGNMNAFELENLIDIDLECHHEAMHQPIIALSALADGLPAFGIVAAVMGVVITMGAIGGDVAILGEKVAAALVGTFLGILLSYGVVAPIAAALNSRAEEEARFYTCIKTCFVAYLNGYAPQIAVEFGRMALLSHMRPSFIELESFVKGRAKLKKQAEA